MTDGHGRVLRQQQQRRRLAHDVGAADDHCIFAADIDAGGLDHADAARRGAGQVARLADLHTAHVDRRKAIHILLRRDGVNNGFLVDLRRQRQLDKDAVYGGVGGQLFYLGQQGFLGRISGQVDGTALDAALGAVVDLAAHVHLAGGVFPHQNDRQTGVDTLGFQFLDLLCGFCLGGRGQRLAVDDSCSHNSSLFQMYFLSAGAGKTVSGLTPAAPIAVPQKRLFIPSVLRSLRSRPRSGPARPAARSWRRSP